MTYVPANFEVATSSSLGENAFTRKDIKGSRSYEVLPITLNIMWAANAVASLYQQPRHICATTSASINAPSAL